MRLVNEFDVNNDFDSIVLAAQKQKPSIMSFANTVDFRQYVILLKLFSKQLVILISVKDTPCRNNVKHPEFELLTHLGLQDSLFNTFRSSYLAAISEGTLLNECTDISDNPLEYSFNENDIDFHIVSGSYKAGNISEIKIDAIEYSANHRGLNIVVFDKKSSSVVDSVAFDTWRDFKCIRKLLKADIDDITRYGG